MNEVYVLSGRDYLSNSEYGDCSDAEVWGVFDDLEKAKEMFRNKVLKIAQDLADSEDDFEYSEESLFESCENEDAFGWECNMHKNFCEWFMLIPETDDYDYGFWFQPIVSLQKFEMNKMQGF